ncbi:hypothetical protein BT96DRAFT_318838 [Gymnopus androsaceus JB14]|uniref:Uncharacterized protein n=1 Tax=Gymnopus androsaceus JB14 TaxID=1447944 RepID=A0A6A4H050_9AGAR|nr:hypothetical protein BT96DRAFT_318838 [Gymnopus androsaceus JB14]
MPPATKTHKVKFRWTHNNRLSHGPWWKCLYCVRQLFLFFLLQLPSSARMSSPQRRIDVNLVNELVRQQGEELLRVRKELEESQKMQALSINAICSTENQVEKLQKNTVQWHLRMANMTQELTDLQNENALIMLELEAARTSLHSVLISVLPSSDPVPVDHDEESQSDAALRDNLIKASSATSDLSLSYIDTVRIEGEDHRTVVPLSPALSVHSEDSLSDAWHRGAAEISQERVAPLETQEEIIDAPKDMAAQEEDGSDHFALQADAALIGNEAFGVPAPSDPHGVTSGAATTSHVATPNAAVTSSLVSPTPSDPHEVTAGAAATKHVVTLDAAVSSSLVPPAPSDPHKVTSGAATTKHAATPNAAVSSSLVPPAPSDPHKVTSGVATTKHIATSNAAAPSSLVPPAPSDPHKVTSGAVTTKHVATPNAAASSSLVPPAPSDPHKVTSGTATTKHVATPNAAASSSLVPSSKEAYGHLNLNPICATLPKTSTMDAVKAICCPVIGVLDKVTLHVLKHSEALFANPGDTKQQTLITVSLSASNPCKVFPKLNKKWSGHLLVRKDATRNLFYLGQYQSKPACRITVEEYHLLPKETKLYVLSCAKLLYRWDITQLVSSLAKANGIYVAKHELRFMECSGTIEERLRAEAMKRDTLRS